MDSFPAYFPLQGRTVVIAGEGEGAEAKARLFQDSPAQLRRLAGARALASAAYAGASLAFIASADRDFRVAAAQAARAAGIPVNVVDDPALCDFVTPALIDRGEVVAAIGTGGSAPMLASLLRQDIEARVPEGAGRVAALLREAQDRIRQALPELERRRAFMRLALSGPAADAALAGRMDEARLRLDESLARFVEGGAQRGAVRLIDATGPADRLSLRALRILGEADVLVLDEGCAPAVVTLARRDARRIVGAAVSLEDLASLARDGQQVARLSPRPARLEDLKTLAAWGVDCEIPPLAPPSLFGA